MAFPDSALLSPPREPWFLPCPVLSGGSCYHTGLSSLEFVVSPANPHILLVRIMHHPCSFPPSMLPSTFVVLKKQPWIYWREGRWRALHSCLPVCMLFMPVEVSVLTSGHLIHSSPCKDLPRGHYN